MPPRVKEEERIERVIRDLLKLPENRRCVNCNSLGPQYVCTTFWTFVCTNCSGVHREFTHRVKSVSMAKFNAEEVSALQAGGNERARKIYFKMWDLQRNSFPDSSNLHRTREFIKNVYVDLKFTGDSNSLPMVRTKPNTNEKNSIERARSFGGEEFYERQPFEKISPSVRNNSEKTLRYFIEQRSPGHPQENTRPQRGRSSTRFEIVDDRFRDDGSVKCFERYPSRESRAGKMSPSSQRIRESNSPSIRPVRDILGDKVIPLRIGEPPKANIVREGNASVQEQQKAAGSTNPHSQTKKPKENETPKEHKIVDSSSLIDFDADPVGPTKAEPQAQQTSSSTTLHTDEKASNTQNVNLLDSLLFELSAPVALPSGSTPQIHTTASADALSSALVTLPLSSEGIDAGSTNNTPQVSNFIGPPPPPSTAEKDQALPGNITKSMEEVTDVQKFPSEQQNPPSASFSYPQSTPVETLCHQQGNLKPATNDQGMIPGAALEQPSQASFKPVQDSGSADESKTFGRKELPADLFALNHMAFASAVPSWQIHPPHGIGYGMQFYPSAMSMNPSTNSAKPRNPFEIGDEQPQIQAAMFPSMESLHGALANMPPPAGLQPRPSPPYSSAMATQVSPYGINMPPGAYMLQQPLNNPQISRPQEISPNISISEDVFASLNPVQGSNSRDPSQAPPFPSTGGNPFG